MPRSLRYWSALTLGLRDHAHLLVARVQGTEALGELFRYTVTLQTPDAPELSAQAAANLAYKTMLGKEAGLQIETDGGGLREINGLVTAARFLEADERRSLYEVTLEPWLALATRTSDHRIFQHKSVLDITREVLGDYAYPFELRTSRSYPLREFQVQYGETDFDFLSRLWQEWGLYYFFEHGEGRHRLVLVDDASAHSPAEGAYASIHYYGGSAKIDEEYCSHFETHEALQSGAWVSDDFDFRQPRASLQQAVRMPRRTGSADGERYRWPGDYSVPAEGRELARTRMEEAGAPGQTSHGSGNLRGLAAGRTFRLAGHPQDGANRSYLLIATTLSLQEASYASGDEGLYHCDCDFRLQPAGNAYRSPQRQPKPLTTGPQTAIVTGPPEQDIYTDPYGRVKVSFHWNRYCSKDQDSSCWIRVAHPWAGGQLGAMAVPRIGQEVIVDFENGDPDRPIITGRVANALNMPAWELPAQQALTGLRSRELGGAGNAAAGRSNHLVLDDSQGRIQAQLKSDHQSSSLSLGHIHRIDGNPGRQDERGQGFELRSDGHGVLRARAGLLLSTEARIGAQAHITDIGETAARLDAARQQHESLAELALLHQAQTPQDQGAVARQIGVHNDELSGGLNATSDAGRFPEFGEPHLVLASPAGIHSSTAGSTHQHSQRHHALTSGGHTSIATGTSLLASAKEAIRLFAYKAGIRLVSAAEDIDVQALKTSIKLSAKLQIIETAERIELRASKEIVLNGGGSCTRWSAAGVQTETLGAWTTRAASHAMPGPSNQPVQLPTHELVPPKEQLWLQLHSQPGTHGGNPRAGEPYELLKGGATIQHGVTDAWGRVLVKEHLPGTSAYQVRLSNGAVFELPVSAQALEPGSAAAKANAGLRDHHHDS